MTYTRNYSPLPSFEDEVPNLQPRVSVFRKDFLFLGTIFNVICMLSLGYTLGSSYGHESRYTSIGPSGNLHYYMRFNRSYPQRSSVESDALWDSLFPEKKGFVQHPELAPNVASIAVFHELHCLNILRTAFFASVDGLLEQMGAETEEMNHRTSHHHIRHCFEYLRQSLICLADSNLEEMNYTTHGVSGWQTERTCRDFELLKSWADDWGISREDALHNWNSQGSHLSNDSNTM